MRRSVACLATLVVTLCAQDAPLAAPAGATKSARAEQHEQTIRLWSDVPDYVERLRHGKDPRQRAQLQRTGPPVPPPAPLTPGQPVLVRVSLVIGEDGKVEAARVLQSPDARFNEAALAAVRQWTFVPARDEAGPVKSFATAPVEFSVPPPEALNIKVGPLTREMGGRTITFGDTPPVEPRRRLGLRLELAGAAATDVKAARVTITRAEDDTGADLRIEQPRPAFYRQSVGSSSGDVFHRAATPSLYFSVLAPVAGATKVKTVTGEIELVVPAADPAATVRFERIAARAGQPLESTALAAAGVKVVVFDHTATRETAGEFDEGPLFGPMPPGKPAHITFEKLVAGELAVAISDPDGRLVGVEFQAADGSPLEYNHNGRYHSGSPPQKHFSVFRLKPEAVAGAQLVCWLATPKSVLKIPLQLADLPVPP